LVFWQALIMNSALALDGKKKGGPFFIRKKSPDLVKLIKSSSAGFKIRVHRFSSLDKEEKGNFCL